MRSNAILVNVARGGLVDEVALVNALNEGWIRAAMTDVTTVEPLPASSPLWTTPNLWVTPHVAGSTPEGWQSATDLVCSNLQHFLDGEPDKMINRINIGAHL
jgi:phosphoglycerate dehydrogenase-like enzyme